MSLLELFCHVDEFCIKYLNWFKHNALPGPKKRRNRKRKLHLSEVITILLLFQSSDYRTFKHFYIEYVRKELKNEFTGLVSYTRFVEYIPEALCALCAYVKHCFSPSTGINYIDSTALKVCHNRRIHSHKVFAGSAQRGKTSLGYFFGFKLHLVVNHLGEIVNLQITPGNVDDRKPVPTLLKRVFGKVFGDKGYLSQELAEKMREEFGIFYCTRRKKNMENVLMSMEDKILLKKRGMIESVFDILKNGCHIEHTRHRSAVNGFTHLLAGLAAYCHRENKPSIVNEGIVKMAA